MDIKIVKILKDVDPYDPEGAGHFHGERPPDESQTDNPNTYQEHLLGLFQTKDPEWRAMTFRIVRRDFEGVRVYATRAWPSERIYRAAVSGELTVDDVLRVAPRVRLEGAA
jgi:hypothetical protein